MRAWSLLLLLLAGLAAAQVCQPELTLALAPSDSPDHVTGLEAATLFRAGLDLIEPGLPVLTGRVDLTLVPDRPGNEDALYLSRRQLLPGSWQPGQLTLPVWQEMVARFMAWYRLNPLLVREPSSEAVVVEDMARVLARVAQATRPAALIASDPDDRNVVSFLGVIWNWTVYPRLLVVRPSGDISLDAAGIDEVLASLSNCALTFDQYITAPAPTARQLFVANLDARMVLVGSRPGDVERWPYWIEPGHELEVLAFADPVVADLELFAAVFVGPPVSPARLLRLLPQVRTNLSPRAFLRRLATP